MNKRIIHWAAMMLLLVVLLSQLVYPTGVVKAAPAETWDKSSVVLNGGCLPDGNAGFLVTNVGQAMTGATSWYLYVDGVLTESGTIQLGAGESHLFQFYYPGHSVDFAIDQRPGHPGNSHPHLALNCSAPATATASNTPTNTATNTPTNTVTNTATFTPTNTLEPSATFTSTATATGTTVVVDTPTATVTATGTTVVDTLTATATAVETPQPNEAFGSADPTGNCHYDEVLGVSLAEVKITVQHGKVTFNGQDYTSDILIWVPAGTYSWSFTPDAGYEGTGEGQGTVSVSANCEPLTHKIVKAYCHFVGCGPLTWIDNYGGSSTWPVSPGTGEHRPAAMRVLENCWVDPKDYSKCQQEKIAMAYGDCDDFDNISDGLDFPVPSCTVGADGKSYLFWWNRVGEEDPHKTADQNSYDLRHAGYSSWDGWKLQKDGQPVKVWYYPSTCCNSLNYAMTLLESGQKYVIKYPGACQWGPVEFFVLTGYYPTPKNWAGWQYLFDQNLDWWKEFTKAGMGEKIPYPPVIDSIPAQ